MLNVKLKIAASIVILAVVVASLSFSATSMACTYLPGDVNHDGIVNIKDASILALAWMSVTGDANFNPACDFNGDGIVSIKDATLIGLYWTWFVKAHVYIMPQALNLKSHGNWITCVILLPKAINASDVDVLSIRLNKTIAVDSEAPVCRFSHVLVVKFDRAAVIALIREKLDLKASACCGKRHAVTLTVSGKLSDGLEFFGSDMIRAIHKGCH
jgi:hypothetical protein